MSVPSLASPELMRAILAARGLSLAEISRKSRIRFAGETRFQIRANFYDALRHVSFSPSLHQLYALSVLTGYRLADWMHVFGLSFDEAVRFQASWPQYQTVELDTHLYDPGAHISWFDDTSTASFGMELTPLSQWLHGGTPRSLDSLADRMNSSFRYLKIGSRDVYAFPDLLPGSIVRINDGPPLDEPIAVDGGNLILAIEHRSAIFCGSVRSMRRSRIVICSRQLPYAPVELELGTEARILGRVDLEIRQLESDQTPEVAASWRRFGKHGSPAPLPRSGRVGELVRWARLRSGLSFREASKRTAEIARVLRHPGYFCAPGTLSDLEAGDSLPRHIHKLISLSAVYCVSVTDLASHTGLHLEDAGQQPMPAQWKYASSHKAADTTFRPSPFLSFVQDEFQEIPFFLRRALPSIVGLPSLSIRDLFWAGATTHLVHPYLKGAAFLAVNRKSKLPVPSLSTPVWAQPLYVLELRNGKRLCAGCSLHNGILFARPYTGSGDLLRLHHRVDAEVLGKVVAMVRRVGFHKAGVRKSTM